MSDILFSFKRLYRDLKGGHKGFWVAKSFFFNLTRRAFVKDWDYSEDYLCGYCDKPVLRRVLFCNDVCEEKVYRPLTKERDE